MPDHFNRGVGAPGVVFQNVSYRYSSSDKDTLKNLNFSVKPGEKIAIVGLNGAGKTTLVKLLSGLYAPTAGTITVGERSIPEYCIYEYYSMLSVVFQDILFLPVSVSKNIALKEEKDIDYYRIEQVLKLSGMYEKVESLPQKADTVVLKSVVDGAVDLSGGEKQKLALARALYQNGKIMILDEPTAALDPIAEAEIYTHFDSIVEDKGAIYISHRLSSCRFCDTIYVFDRLGQNKLVSFDKAGHFIQQFSRKGNGPEEYALLWDFDVDAQYVYLYDRASMRMLYYTHTGKFIKSQSTLFRAKSFVALANGNFLFSLEKGKDGKEVCLADSSLAIQKTYLSYQKEETDDRITDNLFQKVNDTIYYNKVVNDSVYVFSNQDELLKCMLFDFNGKNVPEEAQQSYAQLMATGGKEEYRISMTVR